MSLRGRILAYVVAVMIIVALLVVTVILAERAATAPGARDATKNLAAFLGKLSAEERRALAGTGPSVTPMLKAARALDGWALVTVDGAVRIWAMPGPEPETATAEALAEQRFDNVATVFSPDREKLVLYTRATRRLDIMPDLWGIFFAMALGTAFLVVVLYGLMLRLVIKPVERLAAAARTAEKTKGVLLPVAHTGREDEVGELVRVYNRMVAEVNDLRTNLERRVAEATRNLEAAQNQIVVSERLSAAGRMAAGVAHEVNNPLGGMLNAARALQAKAAEHTREREYLDLILEGLSRIQGIMTNLLQFSRPAQQAAQVPLAEVLDGALLFCQHRCAKMDLKVEKDYAPDCAVLGHRSELGQVFLNLIVNALDAIEAAGPGTHALRLSVRRDGGCVTACVGDTGKGMSAEEKENAGRFFYTTKREGKGTGLGLAVAQHIVMQHRGTMSIESAVGKGTAVSVALPADAANGT
jgi:signal transduction histidine kinase